MYKNVGVVQSFVPFFSHHLRFLCGAAQLLGVNAGKAEIHAMLEKVGADENAELTPNQFNRVMTEVLTKKEAPAGSRVSGESARCVHLQWRNVPKCLQQCNWERSAAAY